MCLAQGPQRSDPGEARTRGPSVSSQALYHWATALPDEMAVESTFHKTHYGKPFNKAFCAQRAIRLHRVPKTREGGLIPLSTGGLGGLPQVFF